MPFLPPNQQRQSTEGSFIFTKHTKLQIIKSDPKSHDQCHIRALHLLNKTGFGFSVAKAATLKQQISQLYRQILSTEASYHSYTSYRPVTNVKANF